MPRHITHFAFLIYALSFGIGGGVGVSAVSGVGRRAGLQGAIAVDAGVVKGTYEIRTSSSGLETTAVPHGRPVDNLPAFRFQHSRSAMNPIGFSGEVTISFEARTVSVTLPTGAGWRFELPGEEARSGGLTTGLAVVKAEGISRFSANDWPQREGFTPITDDACDCPERGCMAGGLNARRAAYSFQDSRCVVACSSPLSACAWISTSDSACCRCCADVQ